jgi:tartrate-resistant acid phosphatase type 5
LTRRPLPLGAVLACCLTAVLTGQPQGTPAPYDLSPAVLARLPADWRGPAGVIKAVETEQARLLRIPEDALRQAIGRLLVRARSADGFVRRLLKTETSPAVRATVVAAIAGDARWMAMTGTPALLEDVVAADPDATVSVAALEGLRRVRMRGLNALLAARVQAARQRGEDATALTRLLDEQERWIALERGTMLPAFLRTPPPVFRVKAAEEAVRVLAFGDFGNGSPEQKALAGTLAAYHQGRPLDFAITLGDNFYSVGMESPADPRWQTWFEDLYGPLGITFYAALGNHDWGHPDSPAAEVLYSARTTSWKMPASYYTFTAGPVQFFALDTQTIAASEKQRQWLDVELGRSTARWKVVYGHHPIFSGGNYQDRPDLISSVLPLLYSRADVYVCGHDHNLQALRPEGTVHFYVAGGGGAGLYDLRPYDRSIFASRSNGFAVIDADDGRLTVTLVDGTGRPVYEHSLRKPSLSIAPGSQR